MLFLRWGKKFKHGGGGVKPNLAKALDSFLKGAARGSTLAMVDAGLVYWEMGKKEEGIALYLKAAELGDAAGQCNLGLSYLQGTDYFFKCFSLFIDMGVMRLGKLDYCISVYYRVGMKSWEVLI